MKKLKLGTLGWAALIVLTLQVTHLLTQGDQTQQPGSLVEHPVTKVELRKKDAQLRGPTTMPVKSYTPGKVVTSELPNELRDYSKFRERMLNRGRTEEQIARKYRRAIQKHVESQIGHQVKTERNLGMELEEDYIE